MTPSSSSGGISVPPWPSAHAGAAAPGAHRYEMTFFYYKTTISTFSLKTSNQESLFSLYRYGGATATHHQESLDSSLQVNEL